MTTYTHRYLSRIVVQAETPLAVGSGERDVLTNQLVATDCNGLPYIPGTTLAGVFRHALEKNLNKQEVNLIMGFQGEKKENGNDEGLGSRLIITHAQMIGKEGVPIEGISDINWKDPFYEKFQALPVRQHVRISHRGAAEDRGKFDEQVVYKGVRFCFEMELVSDGKEDDTWNEMLGLFNSPFFRIGGGTRKGFGELSVIESKSISLDLSQTEGLDLYLSKTSKLNDSFWNNYSDSKNNNGQSANWIIYELHLKPENFYLFSSGLESVDAKMIPVSEKVINWNASGIPSFSEEKILIPATSVKGAMAHRVAFHYDQLLGVFADTLSRELLKEKKYHFNIDSKADDEQGKLFEIATVGNPAVRSLFGYSVNDEDGQCGNVIFSDLFKDDATKAKKKILNHVSIDRFTGGAMDGALFNEEVVYAKNESYVMKIQVAKEVLVGDVEKAFNKALGDLCNGMLPLGGGTMRGHGCFTGIIKKNGKEFKNEN